MQNKQTRKIWINGIVQGVGFRPFVYNLAISFHLTGWVRNTSKGVDIVCSGSIKNIEAFINALRTKPPVLSRIDQFVVSQSEYLSFSTFDIITSKPNPNDFIPISPDMSICDDCLRELFSSDDHRYRYPFINCTNCGPRFTIIKDIPYDRPYTTMADFPLCDYCAEEYKDPKNRRFHAQPVACPTCGPKITLHQKNPQTADFEGEEAVQVVRSMLNEGKIVAIKGLGGYHLACDAKSSKAVEKLRSRKKRSDKPFALMSFDINSIQKFCDISQNEAALLSSKERPIVLLDKKPNTEIAEACAPGQNTLGFMLPYTPLHYLILEPGQQIADVLVMTSGNLSDEPIAYQDVDAFERLNNIADAFLVHDRDIHTRVDDSVTRIINKQPYILRRSRGYAPNSIPTPVEMPHILGVGAELKNTFCLSREQYAFLSHHIGDLENLETLEAFESGISHFENIFRIKPTILAADLHPNYLATRYAKQRAESQGLPLYEIQHHHAHLTACLADNGWDDPQKPVIGLVFDGTGYGTDGAIWGGEILTGNYTQYERKYHLKYTPLAGGDLAVKTPSRMALSHLWSAGLPWEDTLPCSSSLCMEERTVLRLQLEKGINAVPTSSMGRLFDAAAAIIGIRQKVTYEGQAAIEMENMVDPSETGFYPFNIRDNHIDPTPLWEQLITDKFHGTPIPVLAARFHNSISQICLDICQKIQNEMGITDVALSGGVWQNKVLFLNTTNLLNNHKFDVLYHKQVPTNDGGLALGQTVTAAYLYKLYS